MKIGINYMKIGINYMKNYIELLLTSNNYLNDSDFFVAIFCDIYCRCRDNVSYLSKKKIRAAQLILNKFKLV